MLKSGTLEEDLLALIDALEKNQETVIKILMDAGMQEPAENTTWAVVSKNAVTFLEEKRAIGYFLSMLVETMYGITKSFCWTESIAMRNLLYSQNKGLFFPHLLTWWRWFSVKVARLRFSTKEDLVAAS